MFYKIVVFVLGWFALIAQFYLILENRVAPAGETIIRYFSYYTILTNILVALAFTCLAFKIRLRAGKSFSGAAIFTAITVNILIVGIVYNLILRFLWKPERLQLIVDELLHTVIPVLCVVFWWLNIHAGKLKWSQALWWLLYPLVYILVVLWRGAASGFYPYPFIDVPALGFSRVLANSAVLALVLLGVSLLFIAIGKRKKVR